MVDMWVFAVGSGHVPGMDLTGYSVHATDGTVGSVDRQSEGSPFEHLVVDTGMWVFGKSLVIPAGLVTSIDPAARVIQVACTKATAKGAPVFERDHDTRDPAYLGALSTYYTSLVAAS
ncbi:PRC-barrel domain containing protein [Streptomyces sp. NBC_00838]|nr:PRC-barrel domain containing protein [Streptomyces sp. NBC_00838]